MRAIAILWDVLGQMGVPVCWRVGIMAIEFAVAGSFAAWVVFWWPQ